MKITRLILFFIACLALALGCDKADDFLVGPGKEIQRLNNGMIQTRGLDQDRYITMQSIDLKVHYRIIGKGPVDIVFVPGWTNPLTVFNKQFDFFRDKARCIYVDLPGQGLSDAPSPATPLNPGATGPQYTMELMAEAIFDVVKKEGLKNFVAVGFSLGPKVWGMFERNYPGMITKLVAIDGGFNPWPTDPAERQAFINNREATYLQQLNWDSSTKKFLAGILVPPGSPEDLLEWVGYFSDFPSDILANISYYGNAENANEPVGWTYPKLCLYSNPDPNMDKVNWIYPNNTTYTFPGGGHCIHWVFHEDINPLIWEFITEPLTVTVPLKFDLTVWNYSDPTDTRCGGFPDMFLTMKGEGTISHLGKITTVMTFCSNLITGVYGPAD
jgi:pimeloyl-ACP methyl ester carboxylesterase